MSFEVKFWQIVFKGLWLFRTLKPAVKIQTLVTKPDYDVMLTKNGCIWEIRCVLGKRRGEEWKYFC